MAKLRAYVSWSAEHGWERWTGEQFANLDRPHRYTLVFDSNIAPPKIGEMLRLNEKTVHEKISGCQIWHGAGAGRPNPYRKGYMSYRGRVRSCHRIVLANMLGIPYEALDGLSLSTTCGNMMCLAPEHIAPSYAGPRAKKPVERDEASIINEILEREEAEIPAHTVARSRAKIPSRDAFDILKGNDDDDHNDD